MLARAVQRPARLAAGRRKLAPLAPTAAYGGANQQQCRLFALSGFAVTGNVHA
ncbi:hypothetical protein J7Y63_004517 [Salmonella enterica]|nr:hypothetical protein [Salmonella enterica]